MLPRILPERGNVKRAKPSLATARILYSEDKYMWCKDRYRKRRKEVQTVDPGCAETLMKSVSECCSSAERKVMHVSRPCRPPPTMFHIQPCGAAYVAKHDCITSLPLNQLCRVASANLSSVLTPFCQPRQPERLLDCLHSSFLATCCMLGQSRFITVLWPFVASASQPPHGARM